MLVLRFGASSTLEVALMPEKRPAPVDDGADELWPKSDMVGSVRGGIASAGGAPQEFVCSGSQEPRFDQLSRRVLINFVLAKVASIGEKTSQLFVLPSSLTSARC